MSDFIIFSIDVFASLFIFALGIVLLVIVCFYISDVTQSKHAIRRNYPVIGRFRYFFERQGEFFRQYFFAMDREELPFNRAERSWVYRAAKNVDRTTAFGSTQSLEATGTVMFMNCAFPTLDEEALDPSEVTLGPYCPKPYTTNALFNISGMSFGALSKPAVRALSRGAKLAGCWMNTGEGGLSSYHLEGGADIVFQIGTAKYGVRDEHGKLSTEKLKAIADHEQVKMFEIKMSQGAKPGKGGMLPGRKVTAEIAKIRGIPEGQDSISPNGHPEIKSPADLLDMVAMVRNTTGKPTGFKAVIGEYTWLETLFSEINNRGIESAPDFITIDSADGGTGAAPQPLMDSVGLPLRESLPLVVDLLKKHGLRERVKVIASGKLIVPSKVAWALALGADFIVSARGHMFSLGCIQALQCNKDTCPTGITTHNERLQRGLDVTDKAQRVANYNKYIHYGAGLIAHSCGVSSARELARQHVRVVQENGLSEPLDKMYEHYNK
ncbi:MULTISPECIES: FMN-binding glutamate synthase family protein [unclassified Pseudoalteromonas]|jgi:glutamate synthase domain-containing protein 2|uniref:FMN-binding glutamate synthase family protein n=1 Tax=Pseudoalteromonas TaxID=53246 RepID=UPI00101FB526|nr:MULTISPECIES: FMN-binding glutamate synthase family protein [unclassified Pseudoalteromonas]MCG9708271.1 FMN-binding glutamate synthase family protein [Pseudoalteromonas sp. Isolate3]MCP4588497.1 FMN-binding glutamate synthase family protein [Pseudoalteromonas sp.]NIZ05730.1 FMN-binding glutamate synthase family protein [Pseudoalteromonas sp. HF66]RZD21425.1 FMN-binding glutamate synthase family protein [Pseudoalteromonas sp. MEBiC 03485]URQ90290.1 FMN-binding glutamate synthase family prot